MSYALPSTPELREAWLLWMKLWSQTARDPEPRHVMDELYDTMRREFTDEITEGIERGELHCDDISAAVTLLLALIDGFGLKAMMRDTPEAVREAQHLIGDAIAPRLGSSAGLPFRLQSGSRPVKESD